MLIRVRPLGGATYTGEPQWRISREYDFKTDLYFLLDPTTVTMMRYKRNA